MTPHPRRTLFRSAAGPLAALVLLAWAAAAGAATYTPTAAGTVEVVPVGGKDYVVLGDKPLVMTLLGPGTLSGYARAGFDEGEDGQKSGVLRFEGVTERVIRIPLTFKPSKSSTWDDGRVGTPSAGRKFEVYVPAGVHDIRIAGDLPEGGLLAAVFYYDGPSQQEARAVKSGKKRVSPWKYRNRFNMEVIYDDNPLTQSDDAVDAFVDGVSPEQFRIQKYDDLIIAPTLDTSAERKFTDWGKTRLRFKMTRWMYTQNPIKTNTDLHWYVRQYFSGGKSLEAYYHYAPEQYIRQLGDRPPYGGESDYKEFRFTRNVANLNWRHRVSSKFNYQVILETNMRYYNKPFIENDIEAWEIRGSVGYKAHRRLKLSFDYSYEDAKARGYDSVDESPENSDDGDASYLRDLYRVGFDWTTRWARPVFDSVDGSFLFMDYYYPTDKPLFDDPYHVGRRDKVIKVSVSFSRRINRDLSAYASFRYSERTVESPYYGDITLDKDYIQHRYWVGMDYRF